MKRLLIIILIAFVFLNCSSENKKNQDIIKKELSNKIQKAETETVTLVQQMILGRWVETDGDSNNIMIISKDSIIGGFAQECWSKYNINLEKDHIKTTNEGQYWFGFSYQRCHRKGSYNEYFGNILIDKLHIRCHDGIDEGETVVFKKIN